MGLERGERGDDVLSTIPVPVLAAREMVRGAAFVALLLPAAMADEEATTGRGRGGGGGNNSGCSP